MKGISSSLTAFSGLPALRASSSASSSPWDSSTSARRRSAAWRSAGVVRDHVSKAVRAAATARSTSARPDMGSRASSSPVAGVTTDSVAPSAASTSSPSMKFLSVGAAVVVLMPPILAPHDKRGALMEHIGVERRGDVALVRIDRPPANALDAALLAEGHEVVGRLRDDPPRAVVVTGRDGFFSAGVDLKVAPTLEAGAQREMVAGINRLFASWYTLPLPVVAAGNGHAIAGGLILALCADHRVGTHRGKYGLTELSVGIPYPVVALAVVRAELTVAAARRLALGAELVGPQEALELGCLDELVDDPLARALEVAARLAELPVEAYAAAKAGLRPELPDPDADPLLGGWISGHTD